MIVIRRYKEKDKEEVKKLNILALKDTNAYIDCCKLDEDIGHIDKIYLKNRGEFIVGILNNKIVAMGALKNISKNEAEIKRMRVHPKFQGRGYGQKILEKLEKTAIKLGYKKLKLDTLSAQIAAQKLYENNSYKKYLQRKYKGYLKLFYRKTLNLKCQN